MIRVKDENNNIINGLMKNEIGALIVSDVSEYNRYVQSKQQLETINKLKQDNDIISSEMAELKQDMGEIKNLLQTLINNSK
jgi:hypothetical protein